MIQIVKTVLSASLTIIGVSFASDYASAYETLSPTLVQQLRGVEHTEDGGLFVANRQRITIAEQDCRVDIRFRNTEYGGRRLSYASSWENLIDQLASATYRFNIEGSHLYLNAINAPSGYDFSLSCNDLSAVSAAVFSAHSAGEPQYTAAEQIDHGSYVRVVQPRVTTAAGVGYFQYIPVPEEYYRRRNAEGARSATDDIRARADALCFLFGYERVRYRHGNTQSEYHSVSATFEDRSFQPGELLVVPTRRGPVSAPSGGAGTFNRVDCVKHGAGVGDMLINLDGVSPDFY